MPKYTVRHTAGYRFVTYGFQRAIYVIFRRLGAEISHFTGPSILQAGPRLNTTYANIASRKTIWKLLLMSPKA
jgi:hypothetical protein